jgi:hypothetical protein
MAAIFALFSLFAYAAPPANNEFASFTLISGESGTGTGTNVEAAKQAGEPDHGGDPDGRG